jgi:hypothetical protein
MKAIRRSGSSLETPVEVTHIPPPLALLSSKPYAASHGDI